MEEWTNAMLTQANEDLDRKVAADLAKLAERINRKPVLPKEMAIRVIGLMNSQDGNRDPVTGEILLHYVTDTHMMVSPKTTVGEIKDLLLKDMTSLEYNQIEIEFWGVDLLDNMTVQEICNRWPFMQVKILHLQIFCREGTFRKLNKYFIVRGLCKEKAKEQTKIIMTFFKNKGINIRMGVSKAQANIIAKNIMDTFQNKDKTLCDEKANKILKTIMNFFENKSANTQLVKEIAKKQGNNIVGTSQNRQVHTDMSGAEEIAKKQDNNTVDTSQNTQVYTEMSGGDEIAKEQANNIVNDCQNTQVYTDMSGGDEIAKKRAINSVDTFENKAINSNIALSEAEAKIRANKSYNGLYELLRSIGYNSRNAKRQARKIVDFFEEDVVNTDMSIREAKTKILIEDIMDSFHENNEYMTEEMAEEVANKVMYFFPDKRVDTTMGKNKDEAKKQANNTVETFQNKEADTNIEANEKNEKKQAKGQLNTSLNFDTKMSKEKGTKQLKEKIDTSKNEKFDTKISKKKATKEPKEKLGADKARKQLIDIMEIFQNECIDRYNEIAEQIRKCRERLLQLERSFPNPKPPSPNQE